MFNSDITNDVNSSNASSPTIQAVLIEAPFVNNQYHHQQHQNNNCATIMTNRSPTCIVIGCKNGYGSSNPVLKYYQVPNLNTNPIARQWYINTLREDLLDYLLTNQTNLKQLQQQHFVCIEHFDEESFIINDNNIMDSSSHQQQTMILKDDAVPSLFEIEVFQKMIAHQEQIALNQQRQKQLIQFKNVEPALAQPKQPSSLLSSLILSEQPTVLSSLNSNQQSKYSKYIQSPNNSSGKRTRIDPDIRAALIQRVPKAVKRTTLHPVSTTNSNDNNNKTSNQLIPENSQSPGVSSAQSIKIPKAVKHTMPKNQTNTINETVIPLSNQSITIKPTSQLMNTNNNNNNTSTSNLKYNKAVKHTSSYLKDILPPPIMQSTKRPSLNKAIKHTGGASNSFYQALNKQNNNNQPLSQLSLNTDLSTSSSTQNNYNNNANQANNSISSNKIMITTTYVYKRVSQPPEIDLQLECEEEEYIYIKSSTPPPSSPSLTPEEINQPSKLDTNKSQLELSTKSDEKLIEKNKNNDNILKNENKKESPIITKVATKSNTNKMKNFNQINTNNKNKTDLEESESEKSDIKAKIITNINKKSLTNSSFIESSSIQQSNLETPNSIPLPTNKNNSNNSSKINDIYLSVLSKYYSRRLSAISVALEQSTVSYPNSSSNKRSQKALPQDLRIGNYPAKCNICDLILENNIELTSHICSHLESNGNDSNSLNTYISPFDAVTTTCGICDSTFSQPFELIKHLDMKHMKQLDEYKCRICEKQHTKLNDLITHLNQIHSHDEMPYKCDACGFRTSFYADAIYHIKKEHTSTLRHFCPYCLKSLVLPYNEKLGHVQCNLFYNHLLTHFNKQENDLILPSKCKHCTKCILHVRHMKDHLANDHNNGIIMNMNKSLNIDNKKSSRYARKRKRSTRDDNISSNDDSSNDINIEDFICDYDDGEEDYESKAKNKFKIKSQDIINNEDDENSSVDVYDFDKQDMKLNQKANYKVKRRRSSVTSAKKSLTTSIDPLTQLSSTTTTITTSTIATDVTDTKSTPIFKKQKALKQTNIKKNIQTSGRRYRSAKANIESPTDSNEASQSQLISTILVGNLKFNCVRSMFKCIECGGSDLKCHFRNEYTCHQCFYNTSCSKSFEYHLHGHLVSKRVALWNKNLKTKTCEIFKCPCGFTINSNKDNNSNADTGNKVAAHLMQCEYKYCDFKSIEFEENENNYNKSVENVQQENNDKQ